MSQNQENKDLVENTEEPALEEAEIAGSGTENPSYKDLPVQATPRPNYFPKWEKRVLSRPDEGTLAFYQVINSVNVAPGMSEGFVKVLREDALALYGACGPTDAIESILLRQLVALNNAGMDGYRRAAQTNNLQARDLELRHAVKATAAVAELIRTLDARRGRGPKSVNVGQVNVEAGGQAIVGSVEAPHRPDRSTESPSSPVIPASDREKE